MEKARGGFEMPNIGPLEIVVVLIIVLIVFGPKRLPEMGRSLGKGIREFKNSVTGNDEEDEPRELHRPRRDENVSPLEGEVVHDPVRPLEGEVVHDRKS
jgi:sec-independent protein translocase protein TatA